MIILMVIMIPIIYCYINSRNRGKKYCKFLQYASEIWETLLSCKELLLTDFTLLV